MRRYPVGAEVQGGATSFRVWAPAATTVALTVGNSEVPMTAGAGGYFEIGAPGGAGQRYGFKLDDSAEILPDPASRFQPEGPHALSQVVDPTRFEWKHDTWALAPLHRQVLYELHIGTFTHEGTWRAAAKRLPSLKEIGITLIEVMPIAEFPGAFGWGYDGVQWFAPYHGYGTPDDFRFFVDSAHGLGLGVILDVVYNHLGPDGNYMHRFAPQFFSTKYENEWGESLNFEGDEAKGVREFACANARYWIDEFRLDGFRFDAVQQIHDTSPEHVVAALTRAARDAAGTRQLIIVGEHEPQHARLVRSPAERGWGLDATWNDDFHHAAMVALTGDRSAYYHDYEGEARELVAAARHGFLFQGQHYPWQRAPRGEPALDLRPLQTVCFLENHDQVANSVRGERLHQRAAPANVRALTALLLLGPWLPMLFQGQEFGSTKPFLFFADHREGLRDDVAKGRRGFFHQFRRMRDPEVQAFLAAPHDRATFERCRLDDRERAGNADHIALHRDLITLRASDPVLASADRTVDGAAIDARRLVLRFTAPSAPDRLLVVNLGSTFDLAGVSEPLVAPPTAGEAWDVLWHSERPAYGGSGMTPIERLRWEIPAQSAVLMGAAR